MTTLTETKCACPKCSCMVSLDTAIMANDKPYCSRACADGHPEGSAGCKNLDVVVANYVCLQAY